MSTSPLTRASRALAAATSHTPPGGWTLRAATVSGHGQRPGWRGASWSWRSQNRGNRGSRNGWYWNQAGLYGSSYWLSPYASANPAVSGDGPSVVIGTAAVDVFLAAGPGSIDWALGGGCVIHKLMYDGAGKYIGEGQTPEC
jgi:hypothetical protein